MSSRLSLWLCFGWVAALLPLVLHAPLKVTFGLWSLLVTVGVVLPRGPRAFRCVVLYLLFFSFALVDYIGVPAQGFVGGAPAGLAYYPSDAWLLLGLALAAVEGSVSIPGGPFGVLSLLSLVCMAAGIPSLFAAPQPLAALHQWIAIPRALVLGVLVYSQAKTERSRRYLVMTLLGGFLIQSCIAVAQHLRGSLLGLSWLGEAPAEHLTKAIAPGITLWRSAGTMAHPNILATFLLGLIPVCVAVVVHRDIRHGARAAGLATLVMGLGAFMWTYSRGAWASLLVVGVYVFFLGMRRLLTSRVVIPLILLGLVLFMVVFPTIRHRLTQTESSATDVRLALVPVALRMAASHPLTGVGLNQFANRLESYDPRMELELFRHPVHNIVLLDLAEGGVLAGIASLLFWGAVVLTAAAKVRWAVAHGRTLGAALWTGVGCIALHNLGDWTLRRPEILLLFWALIALGSAETHGQQKGGHCDRAALIGAP